MKIGVVTLWNGNDNYGMILQCWALQKYLERLGHHPFVIKYDAKGNLLKRFLKELLFILKVPFDEKQRECYRQRRYNEEKNKLRDFDSFRKKYLRFSNLTYYYVEKLRIFPPNADCYISGSDQIWRGSLRYKNIKGYFLDFGPDSVRRISYAPSFGMSKYYEGENNLLANALKKYDAISCREYDGIAICKDVGFDAIKVEDPTLLLEKKEYEELCSPISKRDYIFIYSLNITEPSQIFWDELKQIRNNYDFIVTPASGYNPSREIFGDNICYYYATPQEWLSLVRGADMVVTSSFHGVVFSIIFNVRFSYVPLSGKIATANNRVTDLLHNLQMDFAIVDSGKDYSKLLGMDYQWERVNKMKGQLIKQSCDYLDRALSEG